MSKDGIKVVGGIELRADPAREAIFKVVSTDDEMVDWPDMSEISRQERIHRHMNNECGAMEIAAQALCDFPDAPWDLRMKVARQAADEARHVLLLLARLRALGGEMGQFPVSNFEWCVTNMMDNLPGRLAIENRTFEAGLIDLLSVLKNTWRAAGDIATAETLDGILADEITHVRFANRWIRRLTEEDPRVLLQVAKAVRFLGYVNQTLAPEPGSYNAVGVVISEERLRPPAVDVEGRLEADFTEEEVAEVLKQAGFRSILPQSRPSN